jgi:hypothetical protein
MVEERAIQGVEPALNQGEPPARRTGGVGRSGDGAAVLAPFAGVGGERLVGVEMLIALDG